jgi:hypothetical protein
MRGCEMPAPAHGMSTAKVAAAREMAAATTTAPAAVLGICQSRRNRYRNAEQQGSDGPNNTRSCLVHVCYPM